MTPEAYEVIKKVKLEQINVVFRGYVNTYFEWLKSIKPEDVIDSIQNEVTIEQAYQKLGINPLRLGIAAARGALKVSKTYQQKLREIVTLDLALTTLKYENPTTYTVIQSYGELGTKFVECWIKGSLKLLGVET